MSAHDTFYLPKEPLDLPLEPKDLPTPREEIAAHSSAPVDTDYEATGIKTLLAWKAPGRPFRKRGKEYYTSMVLLTLLLEVLAFLFAQYMLMVVIAALVFVTIALVTIPPHDFHYKVSSEGITIEDHFFLWQELYDFYYKRRDGIDVLVLRTKAFLPGELTVPLGDVHREHVTSILLPYLPYREIVRPTFMEKSGDWLSRNFPLEKQRRS